MTDRAAHRAAATTAGTAGRLLTIGQLSELTGVPVRTIRFYSDTAVEGRVLLEPAGRTASGYRLYPIEAAARLELIRTLRELGIGLPTVARVLAREISVADVARTHADALEATVKVLRLRQAVLRAVAERDCDWEELELMNRLAKMDAAERKRILDGFIDGTFRGVDPQDESVEQFARMMRQAFPELPPDPTQRQVEAWVELVELIQDDAFVARSRAMAEHSARKRAHLTGDAWQREQEAFAAVLAPGAQAAYESGVAPESAEGQAKLAEFLAAWARRLDRTDGRKLHAKVLESMEVMTDDRVNRYWELIGVVADRPETAAQNVPMFESMQWLIKALRAELGTAAAV